MQNYSFWDWVRDTGIRVAEVVRADGIIITDSRDNWLDLQSKRYIHLNTLLLS
jgi:hypothetical protein